MDLLVFAALVVCIDILLMVVLAVRVCRKVDEWMIQKEDAYLYGSKLKEKELQN